MPVSVLAIKCHHCGAEVGRPKEAARSLTAEDLGGETIIHYAPSSNVMDALEAFRSEETASKAAAQSKEDPKTLFGRKSRKGDGVTADMKEAESSLPQLDERSRALASIAMPRRPPSAIKKKKQKIDIGEIVRYIAYGAAAIALLYVAVFLAPGWIKAWTTPPEYVYVSTYDDLKARGAAPMALLTEAAKAMRETPQVEAYQQNIAEARGLVASMLEETISGKVVTKADLNEASRKASEAFEIDPSREIREAKSAVDAEVSLFSSLLKSFSDADDTATFKITGQSGDTTVKTGDVLADRFDVEIAPSEVRLKDKKYPSRDAFVVRNNSQILN